MTHYEKAEIRQVDDDPVSKSEDLSPPPSPNHLSDRHDEIMAVTLTNDNVRCQV